MFRGKGRILQVRVGRVRAWSGLVWSGLVGSGLVFGMTQQAARAGVVSGV
jgi:hypothetical protein